MDKRLATLIEWVSTSAKNAKGLLVPVSGGSDSALCFWLLCQAYKEKTIAVYAGDNLRSRQWFESIGTVVCIPEPVGCDNKEALRWAYFITMALKDHRWLVGSRNRSEDVLGSYSLISRIAPYLPISGLWKTQVMELCQIAGVPEEITASSRQADPDCGRPIEMAAIALEWIDLFLQNKVGELVDQELPPFSKEQLEYLEQVYQSNQFKQSLPQRGPRVKH